VFEENAVDTFRKDVDQEGVNFHSLFHFKSGVLKDVLKGLLVESVEFLSTVDGTFLGLGLLVGNHEEGFEELSVVDTVHQVKSVRERYVQTVDFVEEVGSPLHDLNRAVSETHNFPELEETLKWDEHVLFTMLLLLEHISEVFEVLKQFQMVDRAVSHSCVEILFVVME